MSMYIKRYISKDVDSSASTSTFRYLASDTGISSVKGEIFALITLSGGKEFNAERASKFVWDGIVDEYLGAKSGSVIEDVKAALTSGSKKLLELMKNDKTLEGNKADLSFALCIFRDKNAYLGVFGEQEIVLFKNSDFVNVSEILNENKSAAASIAMAVEDSVVLSSPGLFTNFLSEFNHIQTNSDLLSELDRRESLLTKGAGLMMISQTVLEKEEPEMEVLEDKVEPQESSEEVAVEERTEEKIVEQHPIETEVERPIVEKKNNEFLNNVKEKWAVFVEKMSPILSKMGGVFAGIGLKIRNGMDNKYGRKIWYKRFLSKVSAFKFSEGRGAKGMRIDGYKISGIRNKRLAVVILAAVIIIILFTGVKLSISAGEARELHALANTVIEKVEGYLDDAESNLQGNKTVSETNLFNANKELEKLKGQELALADAKKINELTERKDGIDDRLNKRTVLSEAEGNIDSFIDTSLEFGGNSNPTDITIYKDEFQNEYLFITDAGTKSVYKVNIYDRSSSKMSDGNGVLVSPMFIDIGVEGVYVYDNSIGVVKSAFNNSGGNADFVGLTGLGVEDLSGNGVDELAIFTQQDNVYLLSQSANAVLKSNRTSGGYGLPYTYISSDTFSSSSDFFGDLSIYVLTAGAKGLERYSYNYSTGDVGLTPVEIVGLSPNFESLLSGYTGPTLDNDLYVFDGSSKRIMVFEKPRETIGDSLHPNEMWLIGQYIYRGDRDDVFKDVKDFVVDNQEENIYLLDGTRVWKIKMK